jgi:hypothetical protein
MKKLKIAEQCRIAGDFLTKFGYFVSGRTRCHRRLNYRFIRLNFTSVRLNFAPTMTISEQQRRFQSAARAEGGNSHHVRRGPSGPILSYLIHFEF